MLEKETIVTNSTIARPDRHRGNRAVARIIEGAKTSDGAGVKLTRFLGDAALPDLDPFLLFDVFESNDPDDYIAGFPPHPHRGFETVTYMLKGRMRHKDSTGREGVIEAGDVQWMKAGSGIVHSEMPEQSEGELAGAQLWINLKAAEKMSPPHYMEVPSSDIPENTLPGGGRVRKIAGPEGAVAGKFTQPLYLDISLGAGEAFSTEIPEGHNAFLYVAGGAVDIIADAPAEDRRVEARRAALLGPGERLQALGVEPENRFLLLAARPLGEPVARMGPFVMNSRAELLQAFEDYRAGRF